MACCGRVAGVLRRVLRACYGCVTACYGCVAVCYGVLRVSAFQDFFQGCDQALVLLGCTDGYA
ncbi:hypothetical protein KAX06_08700, partial [candidate division WOR-3 bacterium]|nr:hypothetical protein [candidate division WOR-3 bacterium]